MFTVTPRQAKDEIVRCIKKNLVPLLTSSPGMGKSALVRQIADEFDLELIDVRLGQYLPEDLNGLPKITENGDGTSQAGFVPFDTFPTESQPLPKGKNGWMIFFDEVTTAQKPVQAAAYKIILDKMVGNLKLHSAVAMVCAGNKATDKAVVVPMSTALQSRLIHFEMENDPIEAQELMVSLKFDYRVRGFLNYKPSAIMNFNPSHTEKTFACMRTWEFCSKLIEDDTHIDESAGPRIAGAIGEGMATEFITFVKEFDRLPKFVDIVDEPVNTIVPPEGTTKWATCSMLVEKFDDETLQPVLDYVSRFPVEFQIIFARSVNIKDPLVRSSHKGFRSFLSALDKYLQ